MPKFPNRIVLGVGYPLVYPEAVSLIDDEVKSIALNIPQLDKDISSESRYRLVLERVEDGK